MAEEKIQEEKGTFIGKEKVASVVVCDQKTPMGSEMVDVTLENERTIRLTKKTYELVVTDIASDDSILRRTKFNSMVPAIIAVIAEYDIKACDINALLQEVAGSIDNSFNRAVSFRLTNDDLMYIPNSNPLFDRSLLEADAIIRSIPDVVEAPKPTENGADKPNSATV